MLTALSSIQRPPFLPSSLTDMRRTDEETFSIEMDVLGTTNFFTKGTVSVLARLLAEERSKEYDAIKDEPGSQTF